MLLKTSTGLRTHRITCMIKFSFSKTASFKRKASAMKEIFDILTISFLLFTVTVFTPCKVKNENITQYYLYIGFNLVNLNLNFNFLDPTNKTKQILGLLVSFLPLLSKVFENITTFNDFNYIIFPEVILI